MDIKPHIPHDEELSYSSDDLKIDIKEVKPEIKSRIKKRKRILSSDSSNDEEDLPENCLTIEQKLCSTAAKNNLTNSNVKKILKRVVGNEHVLAMVRLREEEMESIEKSPPPIKLTRAKAKELMKTTQAVFIHTLPITPVKIPQIASPEVVKLIKGDLPDEESDEEYHPNADEAELSDDDRDLDTSDADSQPRTPATPNSVTNNETLLSSCTKWTDDGLFKIPPEVLNVESKNETNIALRTRSKLCLSDTPIEKIEESFIPPDFTDEHHYEFDNIWNDFLSDVTNPQRTTSINEDDEEADPEYNAAADKEIWDAEELRMDASVRVSKKELNDLVAELFQTDEFANLEEDILSGPNAHFISVVPEERLITFKDNFHSPIKLLDISKSEPMPQPEYHIPNVEETSKNLIEIVIPVSNIQQNAEQPNDKTCNDEAKNSNVENHADENEPEPCSQTYENYVHIANRLPPDQYNDWIFKEGDASLTLKQRQILDQQMRQHVQIITQCFLQLHGHPELWKHGPQQKELLMSLKFLGNMKPDSTFNPCNLEPSIELCKFWEEDLAKDTVENKEMIEFVQNETQKSIRRKAHRTVYLGKFPKKFLRTVSESTVFLYPQLLPSIPFRVETSNKKVNEYLNPENHLIAMGLAQFYPYIKANKNLFPGNENFSMQYLKVAELLTKYTIASRDPLKIVGHIKKYRNPKMFDNPILYYYTHCKVPPTYHKHIPFNMNITLKDHNAATLPFVWRKFIHPHISRKEATYRKAARMRIINNFDETEITPPPKIQISTPSANINKIAIPRLIPLLNTRPDSPPGNTDNFTEDDQNTPNLHNKKIRIKSRRSTNGNESLIEEKSINNNIYYENSQTSKFVHNDVNIPLAAPIYILSNKPDSSQNNLYEQTQITRSPSSIPNTFNTNTIHVLQSPIPSTCESSSINYSGKNSQTNSYLNIQYKPDFETDNSQDILERSPEELPKGQTLLTNFFKSIPRKKSSSVVSLRVQPSSIIILNSKKKISSRLYELLSICRRRTISLSSNRRFNHKLRSEVSEKIKARLLDEIQQLESAMLPSMPFLSATPSKATLEGSDDSNEALNDPLRNSINEANVGYDVRSDVNRCAQDVHKKPEDSSPGYPRNSVRNVPSSNNSTKHRMALKAQKQLEANRAMFAKVDPHADDLRDTLYATTFFEKVHSRLIRSPDKNNTSENSHYMEFSNILETFDPEKETPCDLYHKLEALFGDENADLTEEFLAFLTAGQAAQVGRFMDHFLMTSMTEFIERLKIYFARKPAQLRKILWCLEHLVDNAETSENGKDISMDTVKSTILPYLKGNQYLTDWFLSLFPEEKMPDSLNNGFEVLDPERMSKDDDEAAPVSDIDYEVLNIPPIEENYGNDSCTCKCHDSSDDKYRSRARHCIPCGMKYMQGRVYLQHGRALRPARVNWDCQEGQAQACRLNAPPPRPRRRACSLDGPVSSTRQDSDEERPSPKRCLRMVRILRTPTSKGKYTKTIQITKNTVKSTDNEELGDSPHRPACSKNIINDENVIRSARNSNDNEKLADVLPKEQYNSNPGDIYDEYIEHPVESSLCKQEHIHSEITIEEQITHGDIKTPPVEQQHENSNEPIAMPDSGNSLKASTSEPAMCVNEPTPVIKTEKEESWTREEDKAILLVLQSESDSDHTFEKINCILPHRSLGEIRDRFQSVMQLLQKMATEP